MSNLEQTAYLISLTAHAGQVDTDDSPHFLHVLQVARAVEGEDETVVALLHDVLEDCPDWDRKRLRQHGIPPVLVQAIWTLTRRQDESYDEYIYRIENAQTRIGELARAVKIADLAANLDRCAEDDSRRSRYLTAMGRLVPGER